MDEVKGTSGSTTSTETEFNFTFTWRKLDSDK